MYIQGTYEHTHNRITLILGDWLWREVLTVITYNRLVKTAKTVLKTKLSRF